MEITQDILEGDVLVCRWGCIDKIVDFYKVMKRTPRTVTLRKLKNDVVRVVHRNGPAGSNLVVASEEFADAAPHGGEIRKKLQEDGSVRIESYAWARKWSGEPVEEIFGYY